MFIRIDSSSGVPFWQQIVSQVARQAVSGNLPAGERLATVRELARDLRINPNTAARAYRELERRGIVETRRGQGTFMCGTGLTPFPGNEASALFDPIDALLAESVQRRIPLAVLLSVIEERSRLIERTGSVADAGSAGDGDTR